MNKKSTKKHLLVEEKVSHWPLYTDCLDNCLLEGNWSLISRTWEHKETFKWMNKWINTFYCHYTKWTMKLCLTFLVLKKKDKHMSKKFRAAAVKQSVRLQDTWKKNMFPSVTGFTQLHVNWDKGRSPIRCRAWLSCAYKRTECCCSLNTTNK